MTRGEPARYSKPSLAAHEGIGDQREALHQLKMARSLAVWFHRSFSKDRNFKAGTFIPPPNPRQGTTAVEEELQRLREQNAEFAAQAEEAQSAAHTADELRQRAEQKAVQVYGELSTALELAEETETIQSRLYRCCRPALSRRTLGGI